MDILALETLKDEKAPAIALLAVVTNKYGQDAWEWHPGILRDEIERDFGIEITDLQSDKIHAALTILTTNMFEEQWEVFTTCCHLLSNIPYDFDDFVPLEPEYIAGALAEVYLLKEDNEDEFSDQVRAFAGQSFHAYGLCKPPSIFPDAIMPEVDCDSGEKDEALSDIFNERTNYIKDYMSKLKLTNI
jgi:hypothetical protein